MFFCFSCKNEIQTNSSALTEGQQSEHGIQDLERDAPWVTQITQASSQSGWRIRMLFRLAARSTQQAAISGHGTQERRWTSPNIYSTLGQKQGNKDIHTIYCHLNFL
jgi:hypothetical protein